MSSPEPSSAEANRGWDWRDTMSAAADFALLGIGLCIASIPMVTVGAALATGSAAADHWYAYRSMPPLREMLRVYLRAIPAGLVAGLIGVVAVVLLRADLRLVARGSVPGGRPLLILSVVVALCLAGLGALTLVGVGAQGGRGWRRAARWAGHTAYARPALALALAGPLALAVLLGVLVPITTPILVGYVIFALHVVTHRLTGPEWDLDPGRDGAAERDGASERDAAGADAGHEHPLERHEEDQHREQRQH